MTSADDTSSLSNNINIFSLIPSDILVAIAMQVVKFKDFITFAAICKSWRSAALDSKRFHGSLQHASPSPWLMLAQNKKDDTDYREFYSISKHITFKLKLPEVDAKINRCFTSNGWLITIARDTSVHLLHPLSRNQIKLPRLKPILHWDDPPNNEPTYQELDNEDDGVENELQFFFVHRAVLSSNSSSSRILMICYGSRQLLAFCRFGDNVVDEVKWTKIGFRPSAYADIIHYNEGQFYAFDHQGNIVFFDVTGPNPTNGTIVAQLPRKFVTIPYAKFYLVKPCSTTCNKEEAKNLLVVCRIVQINRDDQSVFNRYETINFLVLRLNLQRKGWGNVRNIGNRALFLGHNSSFFVQSSRENGIKSNCIYFADDQTGLYYQWYKDDGGGRDMGIYSLKDGSFSPHFEGSSLSRIDPPMWIAP